MRFYVENSIPITYIHSKSHKMRKVNRMRAKKDICRWIYFPSLTLFFSLLCPHYCISVLPSRLPAPVCQRSQMITNRKLLNKDHCTMGSYAVNLRSLQLYFSDSMAAWNRRKNNLPSLFLLSISDISSYLCV